MAAKTVALEKGKPVAKPLEPQDKEEAEALKKTIAAKEEAKNRDPVLTEDEEKAKMDADIADLSKDAERASNLKA